MSCSRTTRCSCCVPPRASSTWPPTTILPGSRPPAQRPPPPQTPHTARSRDPRRRHRDRSRYTRPAGDSGACAHRHGPAQLSVDIIPCPPPPAATPHPRPPRPLPPRRPAPRRFMSAATAPDRPAPPHRCSCPHHDRPQERTPPGEHTDHRQQRADRVAARAEAVRDAANPRRATGIQTRAGDLGRLEFLQVLCHDEISRRETPPSPAAPGAPVSRRPSPWKGFDFDATKCPAQIRDLAALAPSRRIGDPLWAGRGPAKHMARQPERQDGEPVLREPHGIVHHYAPLYRTP